MHVVEHVGLGRYGDPIDPEILDNFVFEVKRRSGDLAGGPRGVMMGPQVSP